MESATQEDESAPPLAKEEITIPDDSPGSKEAKEESEMEPIMDEGAATDPGEEVSGGGGDSTASSTSGILTDVSSSGLPATSMTLGVSGPDEEGEASEETAVASKTEVEHVDTGDEVDDATPTNRHAPVLEEGDVMEEVSTTAEGNDQPVSVFTAETDRIGDDLPVAVSSTPEAFPADTVSSPSSLAGIDSCPASDYVAPMEGIVPVEEEEDPFGQNTIHSGVPRPTSLPMHTGVHVGSAPPVVMTAAPYGPTTYLEGCPGFGIAPGPPNSIPPTCGGGGSEHYVMVHINAGETFSVRMGDQLQHITGPATVRMVSNNGPPAPMPMQVPLGHMVQQIIDEAGILTHVILSSHPTPTHPTPAPGGPPAGPPPPQAGPPAGPPSATPASGAQTPAGFYSHPHHHPGSAGSPGLYTQYGGPAYGPSNGPPSTSGPPPGCPSAHRPHHHHYYGQQSGQGGYIHSQAAVASSSAGGLNNGGQQMGHCNGPSSANHETRGERSKARLQARINKRQQQHHQQQASSSSTYGHHHPHNHHHNYHYHHDRRQYVGGPSQMSNHHNVSAGGSRVNGDLSPHRPGGGHYPEDGGSLSGGEEVSLISSGGEGGVHFHPGAAHHHGSQHHQHHRHHQSSLMPPASQQPCSLTDDERKYVQMLLSSMPPLKVSDIEGRRALIQIVPPDPSTFSPTPASSAGDASQAEGKKGESPEEDDGCCSVPPDLDPYDFVFELHLSEKGVDGKYDLVFRGEATEISLRDLKPFTDYHVKIRCLYEHVKGDMTKPVQFTTDSAEPNAPRPPFFSAKTKNSISLRWAPNGDNGSKITGFLLCWDAGNESKLPADFAELYMGTQRLYKVTKLSASSNYRFRLAAVNIRGRSEFSDIVMYSTSGTAPSVPDPPTLAQQHVKALTIAWVRRSTDLTFTLNMEDKSTSHGFLPVYHGQELSYKIANLRRNTEYQFRLAANNEEGASKWSQTVSYRTLPDRPYPPSRLQTKGKVRPDHFKVTWEIPGDDGGSMVQAYAIEIAQDAEGLHSSSWSRVYEGADLECLCSNLRPGRLVRVRGLSQAAGGWSEPSPILAVQLPPVVPSACPAPQLQGKPKANSLILTWGPPEEDGGAAILNFEVGQEPCASKPQRMDAEKETEVEAEDEEMDPEDSRVVYTGGAANCTVAGLKPGRGYLYQVRASNKAGFGPWSEPLHVTSGPGVPEEPKAPSVSCRGPHAAVVSWTAPASNGADISEYRLEWQQRPDADFSTLYTGDGLSYEVRGLLPVSTYAFRVLAHNAAGSSHFSMPVSLLTPPGSPGQIGTLRATSVTAHSVTLVWQRPTDNGAEISSYNIDLGEKQTVSLLADKACSSCSTQMEYTVEELPPETTFRLRVQAVNAIGIGTFSVPIKVTTLTLPPAAPQRIELVQAQANALKVRWGEGVVSGAGSDLTQYTLEFSRQPDSGWQVVYVGPGHTYKVARLSEITDYYFRVIASNEAGQGDPSPTHTFSTTKALPPAVRAPRITDLTPDSCRVEWSPLRPMGQDRLTYVLQLLCVNSKSADYRQLSRNYKEVYRGTDTSCRLTCLSEGTEYLVRVAAVRQCLIAPPAAAAVRVDCRPLEEEAHGVCGDGVSSAGVAPTALSSPQSSADPASLAGSPGEGLSASMLSTPSTLSAPTPDSCAPLAPLYEELMGPFSQGVAFTTRGPSRHRAVAGAGNVLSGSNDGDGEVSGASSLLSSLLSFRRVGPLSDRHWAILILLLFACLTCLIAFLVQHCLFANENSSDSL